MGGISSFSLWFSVFFAGAVLSQCDGQNRFLRINDLCRGMSNSYYPDIQNDCKTYLACIDGQATWATCPMGTSFDDTTKRCLDSHKVSCSSAGEIFVSKPFPRNPVPSMALGHPVRYTEDALPFCASRPDGLFPNLEKSCQTYFECVNGVLIGEFACGVGMSFDTTRRACVRESFARCKGLRPHLQQTDRTSESGSVPRGAEMFRRLVRKRQIKFSNLSPGLLKAMGEVLEQLGENLELHA